MTQKLTVSRIDKMRFAARNIVRELGLMQKGLAGTDLSPSAVHTIIELGYGTVANASDLGALLHLDKSTISRLLKGLEKDKIIEPVSDPSDRRSRLLTLTQKGESLLRDFENFGRQQFRSALNQTPSRDVDRIETGLSLFASALNANNQLKLDTITGLEIRRDYQPGVIASVTQLHASYYSENYGFGSVFERKVATEMSEFMARIDSPLNTTFSAYQGDELLGSVSLDGEDLRENTCHLRWFIVSSEAQGLGIGSLLLKKAAAFVDERAFDRTRLWTFKGLNAARHLYEKHGFKLVDETPGEQWGREVIEQEFERKLASLT